MITFNIFVIAEVVGEVENLESNRPVGCGGFGDVVYLTACFNTLMLSPR